MLFGTRPHTCMCHQTDSLKGSPVQREEPRGPTGGDTRRGLRPVPRDAKLTRCLSCLSSYGPGLTEWLGAGAASFPSRTLSPAQAFPAHPLWAGAVLGQSGRAGKQGEEQ